jgi:hypothetical protein
MQPSRGPETKIFGRSLRKRPPHEPITDLPARSFGNGGCSGSRRLQKKPAQLRTVGKRPLLDEIEPLENRHRKMPRSGGYESCLPPPLAQGSAFIWMDLGLEEADFGSRHHLSHFNHRSAIS